MSTKTHFFDIELAEKYGVNEAIILTNLKYWIEKNIANNKNFYDGEFWTYNSIKAFNQLFPYLSEKQIRYSLKKLEDLKIIKTGNYNKLKYDRTTWYAIIDKSILQYGNFHLTKGINGDDTEGKPIPDINQIVNTYNNKENSFSKKHNFDTIREQENIQIDRTVASTDLFVREATKRKPMLSREKIKELLNKD
jgi:hypothetical protein